MQGPNFRMFSWFSSISLPFLCCSPRKRFGAWRPRRWCSSAAARQAGPVSRLKFPPEYEQVGTKRMRRIRQMPFPFPGTPDPKGLLPKMLCEGWPTFFSPPKWFLTDGFWQARRQGVRPPTLSNQQPSGSPATQKCHYRMPWWQESSTSMATEARPGGCGQKVLLNRRRFPPHLMLL